MPETMPLPQNQPIAKQEAPKKPTRLAEVVGEEDFIPNDEITEAEFMSPEEAAALGQNGLLNEQFDDISDVHDKFSPEMLQKEEVVEAVTFKPFNGVELGITLEKKRGRQEKGELNQDSVLLFEDPEIGEGVGVFDGLGKTKGDASGALASAKATEVLPQHLREAFHGMNVAQISEQFSKLSFAAYDAKNQKAISATAETYAGIDPEVMKRAVAIAEAFQRVNDDVKETGGETTACFTLKYTTKDGKHFSITVNVGDSGAILRKKNGEVSLITKPDKPIPQLIEMGRLTPELLQQMREKPTEVVAFGKSYEALTRLTTQSLGTKIKPVFTIMELEAGDEVHNVSDGVLDFNVDENDELDLQLIKAALNAESYPERINRLREHSGLRSKIKASEDNDFKDTDDISDAAIRIAA
ncbi:MAG: protein phosphatase 2C domain-containing protein [Patescibacteria group bacterium]